MITGKKIVLTGANSGIGLETLKLLVQGNNKILAVDLKTDVISTFDQSKVFPMQCDVGNKEGIDKIFEVAKEKLGTIDIFMQTPASLITNSTTMPTGIASTECFRSIRFRRCIPMANTLIS